MKEREYKEGGREERGQRGREKGREREGHHTMIKSYLLQDSSKVHSLHPVHKGHHKTHQILSQWEDTTHALNATFQSTEKKKILKILPLKTECMYYHYYRQCDVMHVYL